jgi:hypothetical protein
VVLTWWLIMYEVTSNGRCDTCSLMMRPCKSWYISKSAWYWWLHGRCDTCSSMMRPCNSWYLSKSAWYWWLQCLCMARITNGLWNIFYNNIRHILYINYYVIICSRCNACVGMKLQGATYDYGSTFTVCLIGQEDFSNFQRENTCMHERWRQELLHTLPPITLKTPRCLTCLAGYI